MKSAVIIGNGEFPRKEYPRYLIREADYIICCDAALQTYLRHCNRIFGRERRPDAVIGDMDSLRPSLQEKFRDVLIHDSDQETNDQTKAFNLAVSRFRDISEIHIIGAVGKRADHTIGNLSLLMEYARDNDLEGMGINVDIVYDYGLAFPVTHSTQLHCGKDRKISIISPDNSLTIRSKGLVWPTDNVVFDNLWKATLNRASEDVVTLEFSHPSIALVIMD